MQKIMMCSKRVLVGTGVGNSNHAYSSIICWGTQFVLGPWVWRHLDYLFKEHICGGVILDAITILSAAHCFYGTGELEIHQGKTGKEFANLEKFSVLADFIYNNGSAGQVRKKEILWWLQYFFS